VRPVGDCLVCGSPAMDVRADPDTVYG